MGRRYKDRKKSEHLQAYSESSIIEFYNNIIGLLEKRDDIYTMKQACMELGESYTQLLSFNSRPDLKYLSNKFLPVIKKHLAENLKLKALQGKINPFTAAFLLKAEHGLNEQQPVIENQSLSLPDDIKLSYKQLKALLSDVQPPNLELTNNGNDEEIEDIKYEEIKEVKRPRGRPRKNTK